MDYSRQSDIIALDFALGFMDVHIRNSLKENYILAQGTALGIDE